MVSQLEKYLRDLHDCTEVSASSGKRDAPLATSILGEGFQDAIAQLRDKDNAYVASLVFHEGKGLVVFLKKCSRLDEFKDARAKCLEIVKILVLQLSHHVQPHAVYLKDACLALYFMEKTSKARELSLEVINQLLCVCKEDSTGSGFEIKNLADKLFAELACPSKLSSSVKREIYKLLGLLAKKYPEHLIHYEEKIFRMFLRELKIQLTSKTHNADNVVIDGCLVGLCDYLYSFTHGFDEDPENCREIFKYFSLVLNIKEIKGSYGIVKANLELFSQNGHQFGPLLYENYQDVYHRLRTLSYHLNKEVHRAALRAMETFFQEIASVLVQKATANDAKAGDVFRFFIACNKDELMSNDLQKVVVAVKCYSALAKPCKQLLDLDQMKKMFELVLNKSNQFYLRSEKMTDAAITHLPTFVEALSLILKEFDEIDEAAIGSLQRLIVLLMENVPKIVGSQYYCHRALIKMFLCLFCKGSLVKISLKDIVYQALLRICSHALYNEADLETTEFVSFRAPRKISYKDYMPMWTKLLSGVDEKELKREQGSLTTQRKFIELLYEIIIRSVLEIIKKLDLRTRNVPLADSVIQTDVSLTDDPLSASDPFHGFHPFNPSDIRILFNLVGFCNELLPLYHVELFEKWMMTVVEELILLSTKNPYLSAFYSLLTTCLQICNKLRYFKGIDSDAAFLHSNKKESDSSSDRERTTCFVLFFKFSKEVIALIYGVKNNELLASCLTFLLNLPSEIAATHLPLLTVPLQMALKMGISYWPLASSSVDALERWRKELQAEVLQPCFSSIIPCLNEYLKSSVDHDAGFQELPRSLKIKPNMSSERRKQLIIRTSLLNKQLAQQSEKQLGPIRRRILLLLGSIGGNLSSSADFSEDLSKLILAWDSKKHLRFPVPFPDMKPTIQLDDFLPRATDLACYSGDRQTKIAACEFLHALVLYMVGTGAQISTERQSKCSMDQLYKNLIPALLKLSCDPDEVTKQLFRPLMLQLVHWFSKSTKSESKEPAVFLDALMEGVINETSPSLRDFSAHCIKEFLQWSIKQSAKHSTKKVIHMEMLLKRMYSECLHPNSFRRLGAAVIFNNLYVIFREEDDLVDTFTFEILYHFVSSLALMSKDEKVQGIVDQCVMVLGHLERIIQKKAAILNKPSQCRRTRSELKNGTLDDVVSWLLWQCRLPQSACRHECMKMVHSLAPYIEGIPSTRIYFQNLVAKDPNCFVFRFETAGAGNNLPLNKMPKLRSNLSINLITAWFDTLLAVLDCYTWMIGNGLTSPSETFANSTSFIFSSLEYFIQKCSTMDVAADNAASVFTPREIEAFNYIKCTVVIRLFHFVTTMLGNRQEKAIEVFPENFWNSDFWDLIAKCVLQPSQVGFNMGDLETTKKLPGELEKLLMTLKIGLPEKHLKALQKTLSEALKDGLPSAFWKQDFVLTENYTNLLEFAHLVDGVKLLSKLKIVSNEFDRDLSQQFLNCAMTSLVEVRNGEFYEMALDPAHQILIEKILDFVLVSSSKNDSIIDAICNDQPVTLLSNEQSGTKGQLVFSAFAITLCHHLAKEASFYIPKLISHLEMNNHVLSFISVLVSQTLQTKEWRTNYGKQLVIAVLRNWTALMKVSSGNGSAIISASMQSLLLKMIVIDSKVVVDPTESYFPNMFESYLETLKNSDLLSLSQTVLLDLLPSFCDLEEKNLNRLRDALASMDSRCFPISSSEFIVGSHYYNEYISVFRKILDALEISGSLSLLDFVIRVVCRESRHVYEDEIEKSLVAFVKRLKNECQKDAAKIAYDLFADASLSQGMRMRAISFFALLLLRYSTSDAIKSFFCDIIKEITDTVEEKLQRYPEDKFKSDLISKIGCLMLIECMYNLLSKDDLSENSEINRNYSGKNSTPEKKLTKGLLGLVYNLRKENMQGETDQLELRRQLHCAAHNVLIAVISCTQTEAKFYMTFLFKEKPIQGDRLWDNILDVNKVYSFPLEQEAYYKKKKVFVSIRESARQHANDPDAAPVSLDGAATDSIHYITSQYLSESSLSVEVSQFDFYSSSRALSFSSARLDSSSAAAVKLPRTGPSSSGAIVPVDQYAFDLELDELNEHECMAPITALLKHMVGIGLVPRWQKGASLPSQMPDWMLALRTKMLESSTHTNVKLFFAKVIINNEKVFEPFAAFWLQPLMQLIVSGEAGTGINALVLDLMVILLSWAPIAIPEDNIVERSLASQLLHFLMENAAHHRRDVFRNNLEVIKTVIECWKPRLTIPTSVIFNNMKDDDIQGVSNTIGIQLLALVVANKLQPYSECSECDEKRFLSTLINNMQFARKEIHAAAAEVVGMILRQFSATDKDKESYFVGVVAQTLDHLHRNSKNFKTSTKKNFLHCLHKIQQHYSPIGERFILKVLDMFPSLHGIFQLTCLQILVAQAKKIDNAYLELKQRGILKLLSDGNEGIQLACLGIVNSILDSLQPDELLDWMPTLTSLRSSVSPTVRNLVYEICMWTYDTYGSTNFESKHQLHILAKNTLLQGLGDAEFSLKLMIINFWSDETRLPSTTIERAVSILDVLYSPNTENHFLSYSTYLLLEKTSQSPDYERNMFLQPLSECHFEEYSINSAWHSRHSAMTPAFARSLDPQASLNLEGSLGNQIRATLEPMEFTPTQDQAHHRNLFNWMTQKDAHLPNTLETVTISSSLLFNVNKTKQFQNKAPQDSIAPDAGPSFGHGHLQPSTSHAQDPNGSSQRQELKWLKRRFLKDHRSSEEQHFSKLALLERSQVEKNEIVAEKKRQAQVTLYRTYRKGDLPDIEIKHSALIVPLQALAQKDEIIAKILFSSLIRGILIEMRKLMPEEDIPGMLQKLSEHFNHIFEATTMFLPSIIGAILEISFHNQIKLSLENMTMACIASSQQNLGILFLEECLMKSCDDEVSVKKPRHSRAKPPDHLEKWLKLAELYKSLNIYDVVRGIFDNNFGSKKQIHLALEAEARSDYLNACRLYSEVLEDTEQANGEKTLDAEHDYWNEAIMRCFDSLTDWEKLEEHVLNAFTEKNNRCLMQVWEDSYYQERYLPYMIRSKLKRFLKGSNDQSLLTFFDETRRDQNHPERQTLIETRHSDDLAFLYIIQEEYEQAAHYHRLTLQNFLQDWAVLSEQAFIARRSKLQNLQRLSDMHEFLMCIKSTDSQRPHAVSRLMIDWEKYLPHVADSVSTWDDSTINRCLYIDRLNEKVTGAIGEFSSPVRKDMDPKMTKFRLNLAFVNSMLKQGNLTVALKVLGQTYKAIDAVKDQRLVSEWAFCYVQAHHKRSDGQEGSKKIKNLLGAWEQLDKIVKPRLNEYPDLACRYHTLYAQSSNLIASALKMDAKLMDCLEEKQQSELKKHVKLDQWKPLTVISELLELTFERSKEAVKSCQTGVAQTAASESFLHLALFCNNHLSAVTEAGETSNFSSSSLKQMPSILVETLLEAMKLHNTTARQYFPRLLQIIELYPETIELFQIQASKIPPWMFLKWINQVMAHLDKPEAFAIQDLVTTLVDLYPQAVIYPFKLSQEGFTFDASSQSQKRKEVVDRIRSSLSKLHLVEEFIGALDLLHSTDIVLKDKCTEINKLLPNAKKDKSIIVKHCKAVWDELFDVNNCLSNYRKATAVMMLKKHGKEVAELFGKDGANVLSISPKDLPEKFRNLQQKLGVLKLHTEQGLKDYSEWFGKFNPLNTEQALEVPGQYSGNQKPIPENHIKITSFDQNVLTLASLRKPKRIIIRGHDEKEYKFLVKHGEDLRSDQRIEQLFDVMNDIYSQDVICNSLNLHLTTYQVIPLTLRLGLLEWVDNTVPLGAFLTMTLSNEEIHNSMDKAFKEYNGWIAKNESYDQVYLKKNRKEVVAQFQKVVAIVPRDMLRRTFMQMSSCLESYFTLRTSFLASHAVLCISHYILGIGDRHLQNFMVSLATGKIIGIDFGHNFGTATKVLPIPELMPFRLTNQFLLLLEPMSKGSLLQAVMVHALAALRRSPDVLLNTMDIFIKEPSLDWQEFAIRQLKMTKKRETQDETDLSWYPKQKIAIAKKKLAGWNPSVITKEELVLGHGLKKICSKYVEVCMGDKNFNVRAQMAEDDLTPEQQVACLIDQATDQNVLGRTWQGWSPWC